MRHLLRRPHEHGGSLAITLFLLMSIMTTGTFILIRSSQDLKHATMHRKIKTASNLANSIVTDMMRQFSDSYQGDHFSSDALNRDPAAYASGYSIVTATGNILQHVVAFEAEGQYGTDLDNPQHTKKISGVIKFISDLTTYGTMWRDAFTTSGSDVTYSGKLWANGGWVISGDNVRVQGGPVFVKGNISTSGSGDLTINGNLYRSGTRAGNITVVGTDYNYLPTLTWPTLDTTYFETYYNVKVTADANVRFSTNSAQGRVTIGTTTYNIPSTGFIIYGRNCTLTSSGTVRGHVTIASLRVSGTAGGYVYVDGHMLYATPGSTMSANANDSLGVVSSYGHEWTRAASGAWRYITGVYWIDQGATSGANDEVHLLVDGATNSNMHFTGTRNKSIRGTTSNMIIAYDTGLDTYPPPGLPEKPVLVTWHIK